MGLIFQLTVHVASVAKRRRRPAKTAPAARFLSGVLVVQQCVQSDLARTEVDVATAVAAISPRNIKRICGAIR